MKANHNYDMYEDIQDDVVTNLNISKDESKSQLKTVQSLQKVVVTNLNISKDESKSQHTSVSPDPPTSCY